MTTITVRDSGSQLRGSGELLIETHDGYTVCIPTGGGLEREYECNNPACAISMVFPKKPTTSRCPYCFKRGALKKVV